MGFKRSEGQILSSQTRLNNPKSFLIVEVFGFNVYEKFGTLLATVLIVVANFHLYMYKNSITVGIFMHGLLVCSYVNLAGGQVVAGSNPVIPTK